jgi:hypothetical protein
MDPVLLKRPSSAIRIGSPDTFLFPETESKMRSYRRRAPRFVVCVLGVWMLPSVARAQVGQADQPSPLRQPIETVADIPLECPQLPPTVHVDAMLQPVVTRLLARSATFRRQCAAIGQAVRLTIDVRLVPRLTPSTTRARATAGRYEFGFLAIVIEIVIGTDYAELLAHEFEHALEQIEQVDLAALARTAPERVNEVGRGEFDTARARDAGRAAAAEVSGALDPSLTAARGQIARMARQTWRALSRVEPVRGPRMAQIHRK